MKADENTIYVLSLPGGGTRGYLSNKFLKKFMERWQLSRLDPLGPVWENFDVIGGTSTGGISAAAHALNRTLDEILQIYTQQAPWIFTTRTVFEVTTFSHDAGTPSNKAGNDDWALYLEEGTELYESAYDDSNYGNVRLKNQLETNYKVNINWPTTLTHTGSVRDATMQDLLTNVVIPVYCNSTGKPIIISNINGFEYEGQDYRVLDAAMATSAAPGYLPPYFFGGRKYTDGGTFSNSASQSAITAGHFLKKKANRVCILEATTGISLNPNSDDTNDILDSIDTFRNLTSDGIGAVQANTARDLRIRSRYNTEQLLYYSFAPIFNPPEGITTALDDTTSETFAYYNTLVNAAFATGSSELVLIDQFITRLNFGIPASRLIPLT